MKSIESSSEDSFAWTSSTDNDSSTETMAYEEESLVLGLDFGKKSFKKKLQKELFQNGYHEEPAPSSPPPPAQRAVKRERRSPPESLEPAAERELELKVERELADGAAAARKRRHHTEEEEAPRKKKKKRDRSPEIHVIGDGAGADDDVDADAKRFLRLKVKQERVSLPPPQPAPTPEEEPSRKKKKTKRERSPEPDVESAPADVESAPADADEPPPKKKKKKHKKETRDETDDTPAALLDKFEAEETVVERRASPLHVRERITFEEDSVERPEPDSEGEREPAGDAAPAARLARYLRAHGDPRALPAPAAATLTDDDDVWLVRAPRSLRAAALRGAELAAEGGGRVKADGRTYELAPAEGGSRAALLLAVGGGWRARCVRLRGALQLRVRVPRARAATASPSTAPDAVPPPATRVRHPLLGADYESAPAPRPRPRPPAAAIAAADDDADDDDVTHKKKKKKKKRSRPEPLPEPAPAPAERAGKRRRAPERWDSERAIEESLFGA